MECSSCGRAVPRGASFCPACGQATVTRSDERRVATVVFADIVGFTQLSERRDPESVKHLVDASLERLADDVTSYGGRVDKVVGDGLLALFGAPVAHEDDAERAVRAALAMPATVAAAGREVGAELQVRVGVNTGEVVVGAMRAGGEYTAMGDVVNTAQRLQSQAEPGSVVVGPATHAATHEVIAYRELGLVRARGRDEPVAAWEALEALLPPGARPRRPTLPLVGRHHELALLDAAVDLATTRSRAQLVVVLGDAGLGKSRLAREVASRAAERQGALVLEGRCLPYGEANVWWPVAEATRAALGIEASAPASEASQVATPAVADIVGRAVDDPVVGRTVSGLLRLMGYPDAEREPDPQHSLDETVAAVLSLLESLALRAPVVLSISDLHWADRVVLDLLEAALTRMARCPLVVVATARGAVPDTLTAGDAAHGTTVLSLDPLDAQEAGHLLDALTEGPVPDGTRRALLDRSGGNPLFLEELAALLAEGILEPDAEADLAAPADGGELDGLPDTLRGLVSARIDALPPAERGLLDDAAVWGRSGPVAALEELAAKVHALDDITGALSQLVARDVLLVDGRRWTFRSDLVREVAYATLTKTDRAQRHHGIAVGLTTGSAGGRPPVERAEASDALVEVVAHHYAAAAELVASLGGVRGVPDDVDERALEWLEEAARRALDGQLPVVARRLQRRALDLTGPDDADRRARLLVGRASAATDLRELDAAAADLDEVDRLLQARPDEQVATRALLVRGDLQAKRGEGVAAATTLRAAVERFAALGDAAGEAEALRLLCLTLLFDGRNDEAERVASSALERSSGLGDRRGEAWALQHLAWISFLEGRVEEAAERVGASLRTFEELGDRSGRAWAEGLQAFLMFHLGRYDEAEELRVSVLRSASERGDRWGEGMMTLLAAGLDHWTGRTRQAVDDAGEALALFRSIGDAFGVSQATVVLGRSMVTAGQVDEGLEVIRATPTAGGAAGDAASRQARESGLASAMVQVGDPSSALDELGDLGRDPVADLGASELAVTRALALSQLGRADEALSLLAPLEDLEAPGRSAYALAVGALARAAAGVPTDGVAGVEASVRSAPRATYLDRLMAGTALAVVRAAREGADAVAGLDEAARVLEGTDDAVGPAVVASARAAVLGGLGLPGEDIAAARAAEAWEVLGVDGSGWRRLFDDAVAAR